MGAGLRLAEVVLPRRHGEGQAGVGVHAVEGGAAGAVAAAGAADCGGCPGGDEGQGQGGHREGGDGPGGWDEVRRDIGPPRWRAGRAGAAAVD